MIMIYSILFLIITTSTYGQYLLDYGSHRYPYNYGDCSNIWNECARVYPISESSSCCSKRNFFICQVDKMEYDQSYNLCHEEKRFARLSLSSLVCDRFKCKLRIWIIILIILVFIIGIIFGALLLLFVIKMRAKKEEESPI